MSLRKDLTRYRLASLIAVSGLLASCGGSDGGSGLPAYAYVADAGTLAIYSTNPTCGSLLAQVGSPLTFPVSFPFNGIMQMTTDPSGQVLYVPHYSGIYAYSVNTRLGSLTPLAGSPFGTGATSVVFDVSGTHAYAADEPSPAAGVTASITAYSVGSSGALTRLASYPVSTEGLTQSLAIARAGDHLFAVGSDNGLINVLSINSSGELIADVPGSPFTPDTVTSTIAINPSGTVLYTVSARAPGAVPTPLHTAPEGISAYTIDSATGSLAPVAGNPQAMVVATGPIAFDASGKFLFAPTYNGVSVYAVSTTTGGLTPVPGSPFSTGTGPASVTVDPTGHTVYVVNVGSSNVSEFTLGSTGALTPLPGSPFAVQPNPTQLTIAW